MNERFKEEICICFEDNLFESKKFYFIQINHFFKSKKVFQTNNFSRNNHIFFRIVRYIIGRFLSCELFDFITIFDIILPGLFLFIGLYAIEFHFIIIQHKDLGRLNFTRVI